jgi:hypothetical protein
MRCCRSRFSSRIVWFAQAIFQLKAELTSLDASRNHGAQLVDVAWFDQVIVCPFA